MVTTMKPKHEQMKQSRHLLLQEAMNKIKGLEKSVSGCLEENRRTEYYRRVFAEIEAERLKKNYKR